MKPLDQIKAQYAEGVTRFFTPTEIHNDIQTMITTYGNSMTAIRDKQDQALGYCNANGIPSGMRASLMAFTNACYSSFIVHGVADSAASIEGDALANYFKALNNWTAPVLAVAWLILTNIFNVQPPPP